MIAFFYPPNTCVTSPVYIQYFCTCYNISGEKGLILYGFCLNMVELTLSLTLSYNKHLNTFVLNFTLVGQERNTINVFVPCLVRRTQKEVPP